MNLKELHSAYFLGIAGIGMSAIARFLNGQGISVSGYDREESDLSKELEMEGIHIHYRADLSQIPKAVFENPENTLTIYTPAIPPDFEELLYLKQKGIVLKKRAEVLGLISKHSFTIAVAGTHGKTTTSTLLAHVLFHNNYNLTAFVGGISANYQTNFIQKTNGRELKPGLPIIVVEADEFDRSFLQLNPDMAIVTSIDADHLDIYKEANQLVQAFRDFAGKIKPQGLLVIRHGLTLGNSQKTLTYGNETEANYSYNNIKYGKEGYQFECKADSGNKAEFDLGLPGTHNVENAMAVIAVCRQLGLNDSEIQKGLKSFRGVKRRFEKVYDKGGKTVIDDYAHHPNEIKAIVGAVRDIYPDKKLHLIFQPHLYTRTRDFAEDFIDVLQTADICWLMDIYPARELPLPGVSSQMLADGIGSNAKVMSAKEMLASLENEKPELLLTLGAGNDLAKLVPQIVALYEK